MNEAVDTRVVEAKFDSKQFEKGVNRTVKKLDELKSSLNLKDSGKSITELADKTQQASEKASQSLEALQNRFTSFTGMLKQKLLGGIADEIVGVFFKIKNSFEGMVRSLSSAQVGYGLQRYYDILTSVQTLVSAGVQQDTAYVSIERLGTYADQTSYSLDSLVSTMSKFKTAGADLDTARRMVEGLSNAAASMGVNAQQAERAYLNMQQAYSKGAMLQNDWISFESLPMVGEKFNQAIIDAAVRVGTLKEDVKGTYKTVKNIDKQVRTSGSDAKGITAENMGSKLSSRWFNKAVMEEVFGNTYYFEDIGITAVNKLKEVEAQIKEEVQKEIDSGTLGQDQFDKEVDKRFQEHLDKEAARKRKKKVAELDEMLKQEKITDTEYKKLLDEFDKNNTMSTFAWHAFEAGQAARSLTDVFNTLKDSISRGWATSFELIFGKLDEAKEFFTSLTESDLAEAIYAIGRFRNAILKQWQDSGGRDRMIEAIENIDDLFGSIAEKMGLINREDPFDQAEYDRIFKEEGEDAAEAYREQMGELAEIDPFQQLAENLGDRLAMLTRDVRDFLGEVRDWFTEVNGDDELTRIERIQLAIKGIATAVRMTFNFASRLYNKISPLIATLIENAEKIIQPLLDVLNPLHAEEGVGVWNDFSNILDNLLAIVDPLIGPLQKIMDIIGDVAAFFVEMSVETFKSNLSFFSDALGLVLELLTGNSAQEAAGNGVLDGISTSIQEFGEACKSAFQAVGDFFGMVLEELRKLLGIDKNGEDFNLFDNIVRFFNENKAVQAIKDYVNNVLEKVGEFIQTIPDRLQDIGISIGEFVHNLFYRKTKYDDNGHELKVEKEVPTRLKKWLDNTIKQVKLFIKSIPSQLKKIPSLISEFIHNLFYKKETKYNGSMLETKEVPTKLKEWLDEAIKNVKDFVASIPSKIASLPSIVSEFIHSIFYDKVVDKETGKETEVLSVVGDWFEKAKNNVWNFIKSIPTKISGVAHELWTTIDEWLFGKKVEVPGAQVGEYHTERVKQGFSKWLADLPDMVEKWVKDLPYVLTGIWSNLFYRKTKYDDNGHELKVEKEVPTRLKKWLDNTIKQVKLFIKSIPSQLKKIPSLISEFIHNLFYKKETKYNGSMLETKEVPTKLKEWLDEAIKNVKDFIVSIPSKIAAIPSVVSEFIHSLFYDKVVDTKTGKETEVLSALGTWFEQTKNSVWDFIKSIPTKISSLARELWNMIDEWLFGKKVEVPGAKVGEHHTERIKQGFSKWLADLPDMVEKWVKDLPYVLTGIWSNISDFLFGKSYIAPGDKVGEMKKYYFSGTTSAFEDFIKSIPGKISDLFTNASDKLIDIWQTVDEFIFGERVQIPDPETGEMKTERVTSGFSEWLRLAIDDAKEWSKSIPQKVEGLWNDVLGFIFGTKTDNAAAFDQDYYDELARRDLIDAEAYMSGFEKQTRPIQTKTEKFISDLGKDIGKIIASLPSKVVEGINFSANLFNDLLDHVKGWFENKNAEQLATEIQEVIDKPAEEAAEKMGANEEQSPFLAAIISVGQTIAKIVTETIPGLLSSAWTFISNEGVNLWTAIKDIFNIDNNALKYVKEKIDTIGTTIADLIRTLPDTIRNATKRIGMLFKDPLKDQRDSINEALEKGLISRGKWRAEMDRIQDEMDNTNNRGLFSSIKEIGRSLKDAFVDLGPDILDGINGIFTWLGTKTTEITNKMNEWAGDNLGFQDILQKKVDEDSNGKEKNGLWLAIQTLGTNIFNFITNTLPKFFTAAFNEVAITVKKMLNGGSLFGDLFGGNTTEEINVEQQVEESVDAALENVPKEVQEKFQEFTESKKLKQPQQKSVLDSLLDWIVPSAGAEDAATEGLSEFGDSLNETNNALENVNKNSVKRTDLIDKYMKLYKASQKKVSDYGLDTKARSGGAIWDPAGGDAEAKAEYAEEMKYQAELQKLIQKLQKTEEEYVDLSEYSTDAEKETKKQIGFFEGIKEFFNNIKGMGDWAVIATIVGGIAYIVHEITDTLSFRDEVESFGYSVKWIGISIAMAGLVGFMYWVSQLAKPENEKELANARVIMQDIEDFLQGMMESITVIAAISAGGDVVSSLFNALGNIGNGGDGSKFKWALGGGAGFAIVSELIGSGFESLITHLGNSFEVIGVSVNNFITQISPTIDQLNDMYNKIGVAIACVERVGEMIQKFYEAMALVDNSASFQYIEGSSGQALMEARKTDRLTNMFNMEQTINFIQAMGTLMNNLSANLNGLKDLSQDDIDAAMTNLQHMIESTQFGNVMAALKNQAGIFIDTYGATKLEQASTAISMVANSLSIFGNSMSNVDESSLAAIGYVFDTFNRLADSLGEFKDQSIWSKIFEGDNSLANFGDQIQRFSANMVAFFDNMKTIRTKLGKDIGQYEDVRRIIDMVAQAASGMGFAMQAYVTGDPEFMAEFSNKLPDMAQNFAAFITNLKDAVNTDVSLEDFQAFEHFGVGLKSLTEALNVSKFRGTLDENLKFLKEFEWHEYLAPVQQALMNELGTDVFYNLGYNIGAELGHGMSVSGLKAAEDLKILFGYLEEQAPDLDGETNIQSKITPVLEISDDFKSNVQEMRDMLNLSAMTDENGVPLEQKIKIDTEFLSEFKPINYTDKLETIIEKIDTFNSNAQTYAEAVQNTAFVIDGALLTEKIGPTMDQWLGEYGIKVVRGAFGV